MPPSSVHFNGSVNLPDAETVMREISARVPDGVRRMTDGETGERNYWIVTEAEIGRSQDQGSPGGAGQRLDAGWRRRLLASRCTRTVHDR